MDRKQTDVPAAKHSKIHKIIYICFPLWLLFYIFFEFFVYFQYSVCICLIYFIYVFNRQIFWCIFSSFDSLWSFPIYSSFRQLSFKNVVYCPYTYIYVHFFSVYFINSLFVAVVLDSNRVDSLGILRVVWFFNLISNV